MLNELFDLSRSLASVNVKVTSWHRFLKECPRGGKTFFVDMDANSNITGLRQITDPDRLSQLRKYEKAAGYSFPSFNILPLWQLDDASDLEIVKTLRKSVGSKKVPTATEITSTLSALLASARVAWVDPKKKKGGRDAMDKINGCLENTVGDMKTLIAGAESLDALPIVAILERVSSVNGTQLHAKLSRWLIDQFTTPSENWLIYLDLLISGTTPKPFSIVFELSDQSDFNYPVNHLHTYEYINSCLQGDDAIAFKSVADLGQDAFAAMDGGRDESFPEVKMSRFGKINLRAMSRESLCQVRYGVAESKSFSVAQSTRQACKNALEWISRDERVNKTWCDLTSISGSSTVLFAYPLSMPPQTPELAFLFNGNDDPTAMQIEGQFEACAETIAKAFSEQRVSAEKRDVIVFVLTKPDGFRTKVLCSNRCSEEHILTSAREWQVGCTNIPEIKSRQFGSEKGSKPIWRDPLTPFASEIVACLNSVWIRQGKESSACKTVRFADALSLLLDQDAALQQTVRHLLEIVLKNTTGLIVQRVTGLLVIEVVNSNPNGDPDRDSDPRQRPDRKGEISPVSFKRKLRDLVEEKEGIVWTQFAEDLGLPASDYGILESRGRDRKAIEAQIKDGSFVNAYWDGRLFGNTFLEEGSSGSIKTGVVQVGLGISVAPIDISRHTNTNKSGVQEGKDRGMAPMGYRFVPHGVYCMPFFVNPSMATKSGCTQKDIELMKKLIPYAYSHTRSHSRPMVEIRHAWVMTHQSQLGSCSDFALIDALTPRKNADPDTPSTSWSDYDVPTALPENLAKKVSLEDLIA